MCREWVCPEGGIRGQGESPTRTQGTCHRHSHTKAFIPAHLLPEAGPTEAPPPIQAWRPSPTINLPALGALEKGASSLQGPPGTVRLLPPRYVAVPHAARRMWLDPRKNFVREALAAGGQV